MSKLASGSAATGIGTDLADDARLFQLEERLVPLLSVIAGMVDLTGFFTLGHVFTAHVTGNLVLAAAAAVHGGPFDITQTLPIPFFILAVAAVWLIAHASHRRGLSLARLLLVVQSMLLVILLIFSIITKPSNDPFGVMAAVAVMIAISAMACQYSLLRLALPEVVSTGVMIGNITDTVLSLMDLTKERTFSPADAKRLRRSLYLLFGFLLGCVVAAIAVSTLRDWTWTLPAVLSGAAVAVSVTK